MLSLKLIFLWLHYCLHPQANEQLDDEEDYLVDHSIVLYLVDKEGEFVDFFTQRAQIGDVVDKIDNHIKVYEAAAALALKDIKL